MPRRAVGLIALMAFLVMVTAGCGARGVATTAGPQQSSVSAAPTTATTTPPLQQKVPIDHGDRGAKQVALTFDSNMTDLMLSELESGRVKSFDNERVVDYLIEMRVPATFFLSGKWIERYPDSTRRIGSTPFFEVGSHSYAHLAFRRDCYGLGTLSSAEMAPDVRQSEALLDQYVAQPTKYFRFPGLCWDVTAMEQVRATGVTVIGGDVASGDAFGTNVQAIVDNTLTKAQNGSIIVMHITGGNTAPKTADALPSIVQGLRQRGFQLVTVSQLLGQ